MLTQDEKRAERAAYMRRYRAANPDKMREIDRRHEESRRKRLGPKFIALGKARQKRYYARLRLSMTSEQRAKLNADNRRRNREYRDRHRNDPSYKNRVNGNNKSSRKRRPEAYKAYTKKYQQSEKGRLAMLAVNARRRARLRKAEGTLTRAEWKEIIAAHENRCKYCDKELTERGDRTMDHKTPLIRGGPTRCRECRSSVPIL